MLHMLCELEKKIGTQVGLVSKYARQCSLYCLIIGSTNKFLNTCLVILLGALILEIILLLMMPKVAFTF